MAAEVIKETIATQKPEAVVTPKEDKTQSLISKISQPEPKNEGSATVGTYQSELDQIKDPVARKIVEEKIKNLEKGYNQKYMTLAEERKIVESEKSKLNQPWTSDRIKQEMQKADFIQAAQQITSEKPPEGSGVSTEQWSYLTPEEKAEIMRPINDLKREIDGLKSQNQSVMRDKIDTSMKAKWQDYDPSKVDQFFQNLNSRQINDEQLIEMTWKSLNFDRYVERAHKLGLDGRQVDLQEKLNGSSFSGTGHSSPHEEAPKRTENETSPSYFKRLADWRRGQFSK